jgi:hypothetical protein
VFPAGGGGGWTVIADVMFSEVADRKFLSTSVPCDTSASGGYFLYLIAGAIVHPQNKLEK